MLIARRTYDAEGNCNTKKYINTNIDLFSTALLFNISNLFFLPFLFFYLQSYAQTQQWITRYNGSKENITVVMQ